ncbi:MAG: ABC transporter substrate-binding protein [Promethearchaeota archaeon]|nr:MAG: ABC transporter substrate-binding protein [Candidatus Lokiarchaeota archaeon]
MILIKKEKLNIGHLSTAYHTNFILMANKDLRKDLKCELNWILFGTGPAMVEAFKKGELDIGYMGLPPAIVSIDQGAAIKCVAGGHVEGTIMVSKIEYKNLNEFNGNILNVLSQFRGKSVGVTSKGSIHEVILSYYLNKFNLNNQIQVNYYKQAEFIALDMKKDIIEAGVGTPALAVFASTFLNSHIIIPPNKLWEDNPSYGIFCSEDLIDKYPEIIIKFLTHHKKASKLLRMNPSVAAKKIAKTFEIINKNYAKSVIEVSPKYCIALSDGYVKSTMEFVKTLYKLGYIKHDLDRDKIFHFNFIHQVHLEEEHYSN